MKKFQKLALLFVIILPVFFQSCKKDKKSTDDVINPIVKEENTRLEAVVPTTTITTYLQGKILDEDGNPLADVNLTTNGNTTTSDEKGVFTFGELTIKDKYAVVTANKTGFFTGIRTFAPTANAFNTIVIQLMKKNTAQIFTASSGATLEFESGKVKLEFPANAIATKTGAAYSGTVKVYARYIDPTADNFTGIMPGMLAGLTTDNQLTGMISSGMVNVELEDNGGNKLDIAVNKKVKVTMPAKTSDPATIPTWHFNEKYGLWVESGTATKQGSIYTFDANCFSVWNLDVPINSVNVNITIQDQNGLPIVNQKVIVYTGIYGGHNMLTVYTDNNGQFTLLNAPQTIDLKIITECGIGINKPLNITAPTAIITVNNADIANGRIYTLTGNVKGCGDTVYPNKYYSLVGIDEPGINFGGRTDANGNYSLTSILCSTINTTTAYRVRAVLYVTNTTVKTDTFTITFTGTSQANKEIDFCNIATTSNILNPNLTYGEMSDIDGNVYKTIVIGTQTWMAENLSTTRYKDGSVIPIELSDSAWSSTTNGAYAINNNIYGKLYNWYAVNTGKLAPAGWHVPTDAEWTTLTNYLGGESVAGDMLKSQSNLWLPYAGVTNTNSSGFSGLPAGYRLFNGSFDYVGNYGYFWSSTEGNTYNAWSRRLGYNNSNAYRDNYNKGNGFSVRCVRD